MPKEVSTSTVDRYGRGYHGLDVATCPLCGRETKRVTLKLPNMGAKARKCPYCSMNILRRLYWRLLYDV